MRGGEQVPKIVCSRLWGFYPLLDSGGRTGASCSYRPDIYSFQNIDIPSHLHLVNDYSPRRAWVGGLCVYSLLSEI